MTVKVAVITASYNDQDYIENCIESVISQSHKNLVHYIYSDASTDNSIDIIKSHSHRYTQCHIVGHSNQGQAHGRNILIQQAQKDGCEILAFLDSDDRWQPSHLENNLPYLDHYDVVYHDPEYQFHNGVRAHPHGFVLPHVAIPKNFLYKNFIFISSSLAKISVANIAKFDDQLNSIEDWDFWCQLYKNQKTFVKNTQSPTAIYVIKPQNSSSQGPTKFSILSKKHQLLTQLKLNIGYHIDYLDDYINISPVISNKTDCCIDLQKLPYDDNTVDEIRVTDTIEKLGYHAAALAIQNWYNVLRPGGKLILTTVDFEACCRQFINSDDQQRIQLYRLFFGDPYNTVVNKFLFTEQQLLMHLSWCDFSQRGNLQKQNNHITIEIIK